MGLLPGRAGPFAADSHTEGTARTNAMPALPSPLAPSARDQGDVVIALVEALATIAIFASLMALFKR
jgi:hypothetical protein